MPITDKMYAVEFTKGGHWKLAQVLQLSFLMPFRSLPEGK
jgi:hypothetical protein